MRVKCNGSLRLNEAVAERTHAHQRYPCYTPDKLSTARLGHMSGGGTGSRAAAFEKGEGGAIAGCGSGSAKRSDDVKQDDDHSSHNCSTAGRVTQHTTHNTQHTTHNTQHTTHNIKYDPLSPFANSSRCS
jgi:hypothetical protein